MAEDEPKENTAEERNSSSMSDRSANKFNPRSADPPVVDQNEGFHFQQQQVPLTINNPPAVNQRYQQDFKPKAKTQFPSNVSNDDSTPQGIPNQHFANVNALTTGQGVPETFEDADNAYYQKQMQDQINMLFKMHNNLVDQTHQNKVLL